MSPSERLLLFFTSLCFSSLYPAEVLFVTIHDLIHFIFPHFFGPKIKIELARCFLQEIKRRGVIIFAVSERTAQDLNSLFSIPIEKIKIIPNGISEEFFNFPMSPSPFFFPYILYVGNWKPHKNLKILLIAFSQLVKKYRDLKLVLIGVEKQPLPLQTIQQLGLQEKCLLPGFFNPKGSYSLS